MIAVAFSYFEMIGKTLNPESRKSDTAGKDFNFGFCDVYKEYKPSSGDYDDCNLPVVKEFRNRIRNGMYHLAYTKHNLIIHHNHHISINDFDIKPRNGSAAEVYYLDPHLMVRTIVDHFPTFIQRLRDPDAQYEIMRQKFDEFFDDYHRP